MEEFASSRCAVPCFVSSSALSSILTFVNMTMFSLTQSLTHVCMICRCFNLPSPARSDVFVFAFASTRSRIEVLIPNQSIFVQAHYCLYGFLLPSIFLSWCVSSPRSKCSKGLSKNRDRSHIILGWNSTEELFLEVLVDLRVDCDKCWIYKMKPPF